MTGSIPPALGNLERLYVLGLGNNGLTGRVPSWLGNLTHLRYLSLGGTRLTGSIPVELGNLVNLESLSLRKTELTGPIPSELGNLVNLESLDLDETGLTGPIPSELGNLVSLEWLSLSATELTGSIPIELGKLVNLRHLFMSDSWGLSGALPPGLRTSPLETLSLWFTQVCAPAAWRGWLATLDFTGALCETADPTIDVAVVYTPAASEAAGDAASLAAVIDLMIAETNEAYAASGVRQHLSLVSRSEVPYTETGSSSLDLARLFYRTDGHLDEVHALRDRVGADLVHLIAGGEVDICGRAVLSGAFAITVLPCDGEVFAHELGHNMGLLHDRYQVRQMYGRVESHPAYGYVNQRGLTAGAPPSSRWGTIMSYPDQCNAAGVGCDWLFRFSNPRQRHNGDPLGIPFGEGSGVTGPADAAAVLNATGPAVSLWRDRPSGANRPPAALETLHDRDLALPGTLAVDVSRAFVDPDGDPLTYTVLSLTPAVVTVRAAGARVTLTAMSAGASAIWVTATDPGGLSATQTFTVTVSPPANRPPEPMGTLAALTIGVDKRSVTVEVAGAFRDPDGDALTYGAASSAPAVASVAVLGSTVTVTPVSEGAATVTVTARDAGGSNGTAMQTFVVTVGPAANRPPEAVGVLAPLTLGVDDAAVTVEVGGAFRDPDGDALTYGAASSAIQVATARATGAQVTLTAVSAGTATIEVTATDPGGLSATQSFLVRVTAPFTDDPIVPGVTPVKAVHFTELRVRIDGLRSEAGWRRSAGRIRSCERG